MQGVNRRQFCAAGITALGAGLLSSRDAAATQPGCCFVEESGKRGAWPLVVGLLATAHPAAQEAAIASLRRRCSYPRPLTYTSTDRNKRPLAEALIDHFAASPDLAFTAVVVSDDDGLWPSIGERKDAAYASIYDRLISEAASARNAIITVGYRRRTERDARVHAFLETRFARKVDVAPQGRPPANLSQLATFLAGCIRGEMTDVHHPLKLGLVERLKDRLGVTSLAGDAARFTVIAMDMKKVSAVTQGPAKAGACQGRHQADILPTA